MAEKTFSDPRAEANLRGKIADGSQDPEDYRNLVRILVSGGSYEEAILLYKRALNLPLKNFEKARLSVELGWFLYEIGEVEQAQTLAQTAASVLSNEPESPEVLLTRGMGQSLLAHCVWLTDKNSGADAAGVALEWLERVLAEANEFEGKKMAYIDAARLQNLLGNTEDAITLCHKGLHEELEEVDRLSCLVVLAEALRREERFVEAEQAITEALRYTGLVKGALPNLFFELGLIQRFTNRLPEARSTFQQALVTLQAQPMLRNDSNFFTEINWNLAAVCYDLGEHKEAADAFQEVLRYHPDDDPYRCEAVLWLGRSYLSVGPHDKAEACFKEVLASPYASETNKGLAQEGLGEIYHEAGKYEEAVAAFKEALLYQPENDPNHWNTMLRLGHTYFGRDYQKARECYESVLASPGAAEADKDSARRNITRSLANIYYEAGKYREAAAAFEEVLSYYPDDVPDHRTALLWLGYSYQAMRVYDQARDCFEKVLASTHASEADKASAQQGLARLPQLLKKTLH